ncbi:bifunctional adenosylcobinamide kinase/adenosylcobinamide-phosphate guanylyltransferase [Vogesella sp. LIG4]|uniref:bifunctional adenosylcobinamide kinase/adenosylcobinamide-phosphate guanylyltransferase n=1 Tax=Vogesella sp. LIG4 TaxID=1192162 RepID=UPI00081FADC5|nr:bifunctional adenosylcobinamide kinase/adenosylcobinamide-phosphate guanylyltransferase [Vogesella sp. LIG4]SCK12034.1 adenosylcobinamide kinase /adenosylcobinamide-phosphate guanylyltransferase [Vogesella sp. LIG4]
MKHLITGGARSGKSRHAEQLALAHAGPVRYVATAERRAGDEAFAARIVHHQARRPASWQLAEPGRELAAVLAAAVPDELLLVDCMGMWLMRFFGMDGRFDRDGWPQQRAALLQALAETPASVLLVSNEIGWGVIPLGEETRVFVDELGWLNQELAAICPLVTLVACGQPLRLKGPA